jgi:hypothetical protein
MNVCSPCVNDPDNYIDYREKRCNIHFSISGEINNQVLYVQPLCVCVCVYVCPCVFLSGCACACEYMYVHILAQFLMYVQYQNKNEHPCVGIKSLYSMMWNLDIYMNFWPYRYCRLLPHVHATLTQTRVSPGIQPSRDPTGHTHTSHVHNLSRLSYQSRLIPGVDSVRPDFSCLLKRQLVALIFIL